MSTQLSIASIPVRQFSQLYSLNDLHIASGGEKKHKPSNFLRVDQTKELIFEIERCSNMSNAVITKRGGEFQGTFACKEIVYAYAMWISPAFMLTVIRAYDEIYSSYSLTITTEQKYQIKKAVNERAYRTGEHHQTIYHKLYDQFKINSYEALPASKFNEAIDFLGGINSNKINSINEQNLACLISHSLWLFNFWQENKLYQAFSMIGSDFGVQMHNHIGSCYTLSLGLKRELEKPKQLTN